MSGSPSREDMLIQKIREQFPGLVKEARVVRRSRPEIVVAPEKIVEVALFLRDQLGFDHANGVSGVDYNREARFEVVYHTSSLENKETRDLVLAVKENLPRTRRKPSRWSRFGPALRILKGRPLRCLE